MADIVPSLFGITPEMYQQQQAQLANQQALQYAQLTPMQQATYAIGRGAYGLAGALGGALGAQDPQLQMISARNAIARQIDYTSPESMTQGIKELAAAGDTTGAMQLTAELRKLQSEMAQTFQRTAAGQASLAQAAREQKQATPEKVQLARELATLKGQPGTPEFQSEYSAQLARLTSTEKPEAMTPEMRNAAALAGLKGAPGTPEFAAEYSAQLSRLTTKEEKAPAVGGEREAVSMEIYNTSFANLSPDQRAAVNKRVQEEKGRTAAAGAAKLVLPGEKTLADIPAFRKSVQATIDPQLKAITATDQALQAIDDSLSTGNFAAYRAAQVQFAKAIAGAGDLSQKELKAAGADPSLLGGTADYLSTLFSSTPTADTQKKIRSTLQAIRSVASKQAQGEVEQQRKIALRSPGYNVEAVNEALTFPQLQGGAGGATAPMYARNPKTGERIMSTDGGVNWSPAR